MRKLLVMVLLAVFLAGSMTLLYADISGNVSAADTKLLEKLYTEMNGIAPAELELQRKLAQWYNVNLWARTKDSGYGNAYEGILDFPGHAMAVLVIPSAGKRLPIYHGTNQTGTASGAGHMPSSSIPIGGEGNHSILTGKFDLRQGDYFYIHVLSDVLAYQVRETEMTDPSGIGYSPEKGEDLCTLVTYQADAARVIHASSVSSAPEEAEIWIEEGETGSDGWWIAACFVLGLGILLVPLLFWCARKDE